MSALAERYRVIIIHHRGISPEKETFNTELGLSMSDFAADIARVVEVECLEKFYVIGLCSGAIPVFEAINLDLISPQAVLIVSHGFNKIGREKITSVLIQKLCSTPEFWTDARRFILGLAPVRVREDLVNILGTYESTLNYIRILNYIYTYEYPSIFSMKTRFFFINPENDLEGFQLSTLNYYRKNMKKGDLIMSFSGGDHYFILDEYQDSVELIDCLVRC